MNVVIESATAPLPVNTPLPVNLLPWRASRQQKLQKQWLLAAGLIVVVCMTALAMRLLFVWQQSRLFTQDLQMEAAQHTVLLTRLQQLQLESTDMDNNWALLRQTISNFRRHLKWQGLAQYPEAFAPGLQSPGLQLGVLSASSAQWQLTGASPDAQSVSDFLTGRTGLQLTELQLRADGWYEFSVVHVPEARP